MTFSPIIPISNWETDRQDLNDALSAMIASFQAVVPDVVRKAWTEIPASLTGETPLIYLGDITETEHHDSGTRVTQFAGTLQYVDSSPDNQEANNRANTFADYFRELFTANYHLVSGRGILQQIGLREIRADQGPLRGFMALELSYTYVIQDGRD